MKGHQVDRVVHTCAGDSVACSACGMRCAYVFVHVTTGLNLVCNITAAMWAGVC